MVADTEYYDLLEVSHDADQDTIKKSYKKLAMKWHPDKHSDENKSNAEEMFKKITTAYEILSNPEKRNLYDQLGKNASNMGGMDPNFAQHMQDELSNLFGNMGGGFNPFGNRNQQKEFNIPDVAMKIEVTLADVFNGAEVELSVKRFDLKNTSVNKSSIKCSDCGGKGFKMFMRQIGPGMMQQSQDKCNKCLEFSGCNKENITVHTVKLKCNLPKGIKEGQRIVIENEGNQLTKDSGSKNKRTDVVLVVSENRELVIDNFKYTRGVENSHYNMSLEMQIDIHEAICGGVKEITFIDGRKLNIHIPEKIVLGQKNGVIVVPDLGLPIYNKHDSFGDLYIIPTIKDFTVDKQMKSNIYRIFTGNDYNKNHDNAIQGFTFGDYKSKKSKKNNAYDEDDDDDDHHGRGGPQVTQCAQS